MTGILSCRLAIIAFASVVMLVKERSPYRPASGTLHKPANVLAKCPA